MSGSALWSFLVTCVGLVLVVGLIFLAITMIEATEGFKRIARFAIGGIALLIFLVAVGGALGLGGSYGIAINPMNLIEFAIGLIGLLVVLYIANRVIAYFGFWVAEIQFVVGAIALIVILVLAKQALFGGGLGLIPGSGNQRRSEDLPFMHRQVMIPPPSIQLIQ